MSNRLAAFCTVAQQLWRGDVDSMTWTEKLIYRALAGNPRSDIEWQLKDLLGTVNFGEGGHSTW